MKGRYFTTAKKGDAIRPTRQLQSFEQWSHTMKRLFTACVLATVICLPASAGSLKKNWVSAKAQWVAHIDMDAARESSIGKFLIEHRDELDIDCGAMEEMGINPIEDIYSVTLSGAGAL